MTYLGLRPGEKLYEELLVKTEELDKTENSMIFVERDTPLSAEEIQQKLDMYRREIPNAQKKISFQKMLKDFETIL